jgi:aminoglycoside N3'-acetyltransferase
VIALDDLPSDAPAGPLLVHTDAVRTRALVDASLARAGLLDAHVDVLRGFADGRELWFPAFSYDFLRSGTFDVATDPGQVGVINEYVRATRAGWRTPAPVFSVAGIGGSAPVAFPADGDLLLPFDDSSAFGRCVAQDGIVVWYGAPFSSSTILHHAEWLAGGPPYRFDKDFAGTVTEAGETADVTLRYHVRALGRPTSYDWPRIVGTAVAAGVIREASSEGAVRWAPARDLVEHWVAAQRADPLALLDAESRAWIAPELERLGRRFEREGFE